MTLSRLFRVVLAVLGLSVLVACDARDSGEPPRPMGNFALGLNIVVPDKVQTVPISRKVTPEEWKVAMTKAMEDRFGGYKGDKLFDFGISIDGYVLAPPGVPVVASPRSALIITVNVWDDAKKELLVKGGKRMTILEGVSTDSVIGSGWTQTKEAQMKKLTINAAKAVQDYMLDHPEWLGLPPKPAPTPEDAAAKTNAVTPKEEMVQTPAAQTPAAQTPAAQTPAETAKPAETKAPAMNPAAVKPAPAAPVTPLLLYPSPATP